MPTRRLWYGLRMPEAERHQRMLLSSLKIGSALYRASAIRIRSPFNADWDLVPDLRDFVAAIGSSSRELAGAVEGAETPRKPTRDRAEQGEREMEDEGAPPPPEPAPSPPPEPSEPQQPADDQPAA